MSSLPRYDKPVLLVLNPGSSSIKWSTHNVSALEYAGATVPVAIGQAGVGQSAAQTYPGAPPWLTDVLTNLLAEHYPATQDKNELPNTLVVLSD